ncbi:MAG: AraC family transcriptional regulator [Verrucomicrobiales bacterium]|nr:AraC family transcriptional regulator [Verrucomicrobiales bacterium]
MSAVDAPPITPAEIQHSRRIIREPDDFRDAVSGMSLTVDFQKRQERVSMVEQFQTTNWALDFGKANVRTRVRGVLRGGWGSFCLTRGPGTAVWNGQSAGPGFAALLPPNDEVDGFTTPEYAWLTAAIPPRVWRDSLTLAGLDEGSIPHLRVCSLPPPLFTRIDRRLRDLQWRISQTAASPIQEKSVQDDITVFVSECFAILCGLTARTAPPPSSLRNRTRLVRMAETWMHDHLAEPVRIPDVCLALRVSRRELEYAFRTIIDQSPRDNFQALRLHAVRRALLRADGATNSLIQVAYAHGVTHLGRFAANYRQLFGENPGVTMREGKFIGQ